MKNFQIIFLGIFIALGILGVMVFAGAIKIGKDPNKETLVGNVSLWGTIPSDAMRPLIDDFNSKNGELNINYSFYPNERFNQALLEALAEGKAPDLFLLSDDLVKSYFNRIMGISYTRYPLASFKANFASAGDVFTSPRAVLGLPLSIDPLVLFYNQSLLNTAGIVYPPLDWEALSEMVPKLTKKTQDNIINQSTIALGHFTNVKNAKDILAMLFLQMGNPIVALNEGGVYVNTLTSAKFINPNTALSYYTSFADPLLSNYSWHKGMPNSQDAFIAEDVAFYIGYASELQTLIKKNPNLDVKISEIPQIKNSKVKTTKVRVMGLSISATSKKQELALATANLLVSGPFMVNFARVTGTAPARKNLLSSRLADEYMPTVFQSALYGKTWLDPAPTDSENVFRQMVEGVLSGTASSEAALRRASGQLDLLLVK